MKISIFILISILFISSCNTLYKLTPGYWKFKSEFKKELELVQKILDNPEQMQKIIETSEFYDKNNFYMCGNSYIFYIEYFKSNKDGEAEIIGFNRTYIELGKRGQSRIEKAKNISIYKSNQNFEVLFSFLEYGNKTILVEVCTGTK